MTGEQDIQFVLDSQVGNESVPEVISDCFSNSKYTIKQKLDIANTVMSKVPLYPIIDSMGLSKSPICFVLKGRPDSIFFVDDYRAACQAVIDYAKFCNTSGAANGHILTCRRLVLQPPTPPSLKWVHDVKVSLENGNAAIDATRAVRSGLFLRSNLANYPSLGYAIGHRTAFLPREPDAIVPTYVYNRGQGMERHNTPASYAHGFSEHDINAPSTARLLAEAIYKKLTPALTKITGKMCGTMERPTQWTPATRSCMDDAKQNYIDGLRRGCILFALGDAFEETSASRASREVFAQAVFSGDVDLSNQTPCEAIECMMMGLRGIDYYVPGHCGLNFGLPITLCAYGMFGNFKPYVRDLSIPEEWFHSFPNMRRTEVVQRGIANGLNLRSPSIEIESMMYEVSIPPFKLVTDLPRCKFLDEYLPTLTIGGPRVYALQ
jgi:hypothetical protein